MQIQVKLNKNLDFDFLTFWGHVTSSFTLADSYIHQSATTAGAAAELAAARKVSIYDDIPASFMFQPVALETLGPINETAIRFVEDLGHRISAISSEAREGVFLFKRLSVPMQRFNAILVCDSFCTSDTPDLWSSQ